MKTSACFSKKLSFKKNWKPRLLPWAFVADEKGNPVKIRPCVTPKGFRMQSQQFL
jgi:hypothetical protein